jgi:Protein of unknown function (DUF1566)
MTRVALALVAVAVAGAGCGRDLTSSPGPEGGALVCDGFPMPNPAVDGLPNRESYTDHGDGTITDDVTGLVWQATVAEGAVIQDDAVAACAAKGPGWRLPTRLELVSLVDFTIAAPGPTINPIFANTPSATFWTSSPYYGDKGDTWVVGFDGGYTDYVIRNTPNLTRCVRAPGPHCHPAHYEPEPGALVLDEETGLTWQRDFDPATYTWDDAQGHCQALGAGWRVPSLTELQTILDDAREYPAIDEDAFPDTPSEVFWTSSPNAAGAGSAWRVDFFYGATDSDVTTRDYRVRCVR